MQDKEMNQSNVRPAEGKLGILIVGNGAVAQRLWQVCSWPAKVWESPWAL